MKRKRADNEKPEEEKPIALGDITDRDYAYVVGSAEKLRNELFPHQKVVVLRERSKRRAKKEPERRPGTYEWQ